MDFDPNALAAQLQQQMQQQMHAQQAQIEQMLHAQQAAHQQELQAQQQALFAQMQQMLQQQAAGAAVQQPIAAAPPAAAAALAPPPRNGPRLAPPSLYDGRANTLDDWFGEMVRQFEFYATPDGAEQIRIATAHLGPSARAWWADLDAAARPTDWVALKAAMQSRFQAITTAEAARARLRSLVQGKSSVHDYVSAFRRLMVAVPDMSAADRLFCFKSGLRPAIATHLTINHANASTLASAIDMAVRIGSLGEIAAAQHGSASPSAPAGASGSHSAMDLDALANLEELYYDAGDHSSSSAPAAPSAAVTRDDLQQLLNALREERRAQPARGASNKGRHQPRGLPRVPHLTEQQVREHLDAGKCFGCGVKIDGPGGHYSNKCPRRQADATGRVSWSK